MPRTQRLLALIQLLRRRRHPVAAHDLARELSVSVRTVYRDIETLVRQGAPIEGAAGLGFLLRPGFLLPPLMFRDEEIEAMVLGARWVAQQPDASLASAAHDLVAKVGAVLPERLRVRVEDSALFPVPRGGAAIDSIDAGILRRAIRDERKLRLAYRDEQGRKTVRIVWPVALGFHAQVRVLVAWCETRRAFRHFRSDRIDVAEQLPDALPRRRAVLLSEWRAAEGVPESSF